MEYHVDDFSIEKASIAVISIGLTDLVDELFGVFSGCYKNC